ncbi:MAG: hypothetical protein HQK51_16075 [Oligoflexia bacterium]|nr:hypothetical protein [Oligoflexia bacterium]
MKLISELKLYMTGWKNYFRIAETKGKFKDLDGWVRRRIRCYIWQQWTGFKARRDKLVKFGVPIEMAAKASATRLGAWKVSATRVMTIAFPNKYFDKFKLPRLYDELKLH